MLEVSIVLLILNIIVIKLQCRFEVNIVLVLTNKTFIKSHGTIWLLTGELNLPQTYLVIL
jgi:hypothetical protein